MQILFYIFLEYTMQIKLMITYHSQTDLYDSTKHLYVYIYIYIYIYNLARLLRFCCCYNLCINTFL